MEKANKALRRSGIRLRSVKSGHATLKLIISDWKESRSAYKSYISNQQLAWSDMLTWASNEHNSGLKEVLEHVMQLQAIWNDVQTQFLTTLKKFQHQFEAILTSELQLDKSRSLLTSYEHKEMKLSKELRKASTRSCVDDLKLIEEKLSDVKISIQNAQMDVAANVTENESFKMLLMKEGLVNLSNQYVDLAEKTAVIFKAQRVVALTLPNAHSDVHDTRFIGGETCSAAVNQAKKDLLYYNSNTNGQVNVPTQPPPYYPPSPADEASSFYPSYTAENPPRYYNIPPIALPSSHTPPTTNTTSTTTAAVNTDTFSPSHHLYAGNYMNTPAITTPPGPSSSTHYYDTPPPEGYANVQEQLNLLHMN